jgi:hypothetical protein
MERRVADAIAEEELGARGVKAMHSISKGEAETRPQLRLAAGRSPSLCSMRARA